MKINLLKKTIPIFLFLSAFFLSGNVFAFQKTKIDILPQNDFVVEPGKTEIFLNPGESIVKNVTITNRINRTVKFKLTTEDVTGTHDSAVPIRLMGDDNGPYSLKNFIKPEINEFSLDFGEKISIPVTISVPPDAEPRGFYGALIISNEPDVFSGEQSKETEGKAILISRIGSLFLLRINGEGKESGSLEDFKLIGPAKPFYEKRPKGFEILFNNTGNVHLVPHGKITVKNLIGRTVSEIPVDAYFALPDSTRYREVLWQTGSGLGRYTAHLSLYKGYGSENDNDEATIAFWIIPWKILVIVFVSLVVLISLIYYIFTRFEIKKK